MGRVSVSEGIINSATAQTQVEKGKTIRWSCGFFSVLLVVCAILLLQSPGLAQPGTSPQEMPIELQRTVNWMGHWLHEDLRETLVREVEREFRFTHPDTAVNLKFPQEIMGQRSKKLIAECIADMIRREQFDWDIIWLDDHIYRYTAEILGDPAWGPKHLVDFRIIKGFGDAHKQFILEDPHYANQTGGILAGPYIEGYFLCLWYNQDLARRIGLNIKPTGMIFEEFLEHVRQIQAYNRAHGTAIAPLFESGDWVVNRMMLQSLIRSLFDDFGEAIAEKRTPAKLAALRQAFAAFEELGRLDPLVLDHRTLNWFDSRDYPLRDKVVFYPHGTWMYNHWRGLDPVALEKMVPVELPVFRRVNHTLGGFIPTWAVMQRAPNRDAAVELLMAWCSSDVAERWVSYTKNPTGLRGSLDPATMESDQFEQFKDAQSRTYGGNVHFTANPAYILGPEARNLEWVMDHCVRGLLAGEMTAEAAFEMVLRNANAEP
jgi:hypothetical protein